MKKCTLLILFSCLLLCANAQLVGGELVAEGRKIAVPFDFTMYESTEGAIYYRLAVDRTGKVTSAQLLTDRSIQISTPLQVRARTYVLGLKFEPGTHYPQFHHCEVKINLKKKTE
ncbi:MAG TPA: hypothetical protein VKZ44_05070 [Taishania sp.]|nr:hypothetical protein [Taishania sp.]